MTVRSGTLRLCVFAWLLLCHAALLSAETSSAGRVKVMGGKKGHGTVSVAVGATVPGAVTFSSGDPNFDSGGPSSFTGVPLGRILNQAGVTDMAGVTLIGHDQYTVYLPAEVVSKPGVIIVSDQDGKPLSRYLGGPLKLLFPPGMGMHQSAYCWYVDTLVPDYLDNPEVKVSVNGKTKTYTLSGLDALLPEHRTLYLSIPLGYRWDLPKLNQPCRVTAVPLAALFDGEDVTGRELTLTPFAGKSITLPVAPLLSCDVMLVYRINDQPIHPALGGPFSVYFPVMSCGELQRVAPETASLFFLHEISVD
ncbi:molybdopterin-dependent oxidoreductase [Desulfoluna butyratoxydans]|uniref:molybdopterin-dependent oxidoreductase n=1 Tax=Desulfoluna butyratoxydans TaxID=231438 RepID=UPI0015D1BBB8|nr:molybdopterin-dependent oxidoreductase [Desulfoluna butyratoxydans]